MAANPWIAALTALFLWWFSTGLILVAVRWADKDKAFSNFFVASLPLLVLGISGISLTTELGGVTSTFLPNFPPESVAGIYISFTSALLVWGWIEFGFLTGIVTGPNLSHCPRDIPGWERFIRAWGTIAYHEMLIAACLVGIGLATLGTTNEVAFWTFAVLFAARVSAKLNLFLGVSKINTEFLPTPLAHLPSHFRIARMNWLFPISVTALTAAVVYWLMGLSGAATPAEAVGFALLAALTGLALVEHWLMVLPLPDEKLWRWMLPKKTDTTPKRRSEEAHGL